MKVVSSESGLNYQSLKNAREFYKEQNESFESGLLSELAVISLEDKEVKEVYEAMPITEFMNTPEFYNYNINVCLYNIRRGLAYNCTIQEQDKEDYQQQSLCTLYELFSKEKEVYNWNDFNFLCNVISNRIMKKITYAFHRFEMDSSFNLTQENELGEIVSQSMSNILDNRDARISKQNALNDKAIERGINSLDIIEELENCLTYEETATLKKLLALKVDKVALSNTQRSQLNRLSRKIESYKLSTIVKAKELRNDSKKAWQELLTQKAQEKKQAKALKLQSVLEQKQARQLKASDNLQKNIDMALTRINTLKGKASKNAFVSTLQRLIDIERLVKTCPSQNQLKELRKQVNECNYDLQGLDTKQVSNMKHLQAKANELMQGY